MKIFIGADSRSVQHEGWVTVFRKNHPEIELTARCSGHEVPTYTIYDCNPFLDSYSDEEFDLGFVQSGWNENVLYWSEGVLRGFFESHFCFEAMADEQSGSLFRYIDREAEQKMFELLKRKCKKVVYIGFHCLRRYKFSRADLNHLIDRNGIETNVVFSQLATDYLSLPQDIHWAEKHCLPDGVHYEATGTDYIYNWVKEWL